MIFNAWIYCFMYAFIDMGIKFVICDRRGGYVCSQSRNSLVDQTLRSMNRTMDRIYVCLFFFFFFYPKNEGCG